MSVFKFAVVTFCILFVIRVLNFVQPSLDQSINTNLFNQNQNTNENSLRVVSSDQSENNKAFVRVVEPSLPPDIQIESDPNLDPPADQRIVDRPAENIPDASMWTTEATRTTTIMIDSSWQAIHVICADKSEAKLSNTYPNAVIFSCKANP